jgi:uncharacterized protein (UPF0335 family)
MDTVSDLEYHYDKAHQEGFDANQANDIIDYNNKHRKKNQKKSEKMRKDLNEKNAELVKKKKNGGFDGKFNFY